MPLAEQEKKLDIQLAALATRVAVLEERARKDDQALDVRTSYLERRLTDLNGEAGRLKVILDNSVPLSTFNAYVNSERDKADAQEKSTRESFDEYQRTQAMAFKLYADEMSRWRASINVRLATWAGALAVVVAILQYIFQK